MIVLLDTNILVRLVDHRHAMNKAVADAVQTLTGRKDTVAIVPQNLYEFWVVCTRPFKNNGLERSTTAAQGMIEHFRQTFHLLDDTPGILSAWKELVIAHQVKGKTAHDTRLVAAIHVHGIEAILTLNAADFVRYPGLNVLSPGDVVAA